MPHWKWQITGGHFISSSLVADEVSTSGCVRFCSTHFKGEDLSGLPFRLLGMAMLHGVFTHFKVFFLEQRLIAQKIVLVYKTSKLRLTNCKSADLQVND